MDIHKYEEKKKKGMVEILTVGKAHALVSKRFDADTGAELDPEIISIDKKQIAEQREQLQKQLNAIDAMIADMELTNPAE